MPRWKALPDELDPQIREFTGQLRRLVDRGGLSVAAVADHTGYSKTSWERYLNGRLLAPKGAIVALAEVTGTNPIHLTTMWELAERAWSRAEMRHDMTMEAIRISQARAALGEFGEPQAGAGGGSATRTEGRAPAAPGGAAPGVAAPGVAGPTGVSPTIPPQPGASDVDADARQGAARNSSAYAPGSPSAPPSSDGSDWTPSAPNPFGDPPRDARPGGPSAPASGGRRRLTMLFAGVGGVLVVVAAVFLLTGNGGDKEAAGHGGTAKSPSPAASSAHALPAGVKCAGAACTGKDAERMGCSGNLVTTARTATVGTTTVEVRYSRTCGAAWGRITGAAQGDQVGIVAGRASQKGAIAEAGDTIAYTPMVAVKDAAEAKACVTSAAGRKGCTP
ncbi:DUF2690 domain-containing protein [Streptomyces sp. NPDC046805]|uniref:helix-turn-helix domain-containing protein n=1 Tax=Streptomyces sp. NPDC046805 TaxID=3155134 RepID=UPI0033F9AB7B